MQGIPKYDGTIDPQEHVILCICMVKGNNMDPDEIESLLLKKFRVTLSKEAMTWYSQLLEHYIKF